MRTKSLAWILHAPIWFAFADFLISAINFFSCCSSFWRSLSSSRWAFSSARWCYSYEIARCQRTGINIACDRPPTHLSQTLLWRYSLAKNPFDDAHCQKYTNTRDREWSAEIGAIADLSAVSRRRRPGKDTSPTSLC